TESGRESHDSRHDTSSQAAKDFKEASDYFTSRKTTTSGNITDNNASSRGSTDSTTESGRESHDSRHDTSSQAAKDFKEASDYFTSRK
ncbi:hypothetical protein, partial [Enterococcus faecium]|uniref:hypothetical protein n=1 Tax=Enterococcus faecium TaxID=1352 RepID=UPI001C54148A